MSVSSQTEKATKGSCLNCGPGRRRSPSDKPSRRSPRSIPYPRSHKTSKSGTPSGSLPQAAVPLDTSAETRTSEPYVAPGSPSQTNNSALSLLMRSDVNWPNEFSPADDYLLQSTTLSSSFEAEKSGKLSTVRHSSSSTLQPQSLQFGSAIPVTASSSFSERQPLISDWSESATATTTLTRASVITTATADTVVSPTSCSSLPTTQSEPLSDSTPVSSRRQKIKKRILRLLPRQRQTKQSPKSWTFGLL